jgi:hypothetical protein
MATLLRQPNRWYIAAAEIPALAASLVIAEVFYKFHSFTLEALAFLATWTVLGSIGGWVAPAVRWRVEQRRSL